LVLDGVFQDDHGDSPTGSYIRNPPTSHHTPRSVAGCVIFVKLWQFDPDDRTQVRLDTTATPFTPAPGRPGVELIPLFRDGREDVRIERWAPNRTMLLDAPGGAELLVREGSFADDEDASNRNPGFGFHPEYARPEVRFGPRPGRKAAKPG
jgi:ChrR Cupin-like domain